MGAKSMREANINMRATSQEKSLLEKAAEVAGFSNLTNFMMTVARKEAMRILNDVNATYLSARDWGVVNQLLINPSEPNAELKKLLKNKEQDRGKVGRRKAR